MMSAIWFGFMLPEMLLQMKLIIFQRYPTKQAAFLHEQSVPYSQILIKPLLLVPECYFA